MSPSVPNFPSPKLVTTLHTWQVLLQLAKQLARIEAQQRHTAEQVGRLLEQQQRSKKRKRGNDGDDEGYDCLACLNHFEGAMPDVFTCGLHAMCVDCFVRSIESAGWTACPGCRAHPCPWPQVPERQRELEKGRIARIFNVRLSLGHTESATDRQVKIQELHSLVRLQCYRPALEDGWACLGCTAYNTNGRDRCTTCNTPKHLSQAWFCAMCTSWNYDNANTRCLYCSSYRRLTVNPWMAVDDDDDSEVEILPNFAVPIPPRPSIDVAGRLVDAFPGAPGSIVMNIVEIVVVHDIYPRPPPTHRRQLLFSCVGM